MQKKRHPLDSVEELRTRQVDDEARSLAEKRRETEAAAHAETRALNHLVSVTRAIETIKEEETSRLASSGARAGDLAVQAAWSAARTASACSPDVSSRQLDVSIGSSTSI